MKEKVTDDLIKVSVRVAEVASFIQTSMCINGTVKLDGMNNYRNNKGLIFKCKDKERGTFYIGWYKRL